MSTSRSADTIFSCSSSSPYSSLKSAVSNQHTHTYTYMYIDYRERESERENQDKCSAHGVQLLVELQFGWSGLWGERTSIDISWMAQQAACPGQVVPYVPSSPKYQDLALLILHCFPSISFSLYGSIFFLLALARSPLPPHYLTLCCFYCA